MRRILTSTVCAVVAVGAVSLSCCDTAMAITKDECIASAGAWGQIGAAQGGGYCYRALLKPAGVVVAKAAPRPTPKACKAKHHRRSIYTGNGGPSGCPPS
jgi:hypothetical protein